MVRIRVVGPVEAGLTVVIRLEDARALVLQDEDGGQDLGRDVPEGSLDHADPEAGSLRSPQQQGRCEAAVGQGQGAERIGRVEADAVPRADPLERDQQRIRPLELVGWGRFPVGGFSGCLRLAGGWRRITLRGGES